jgi:hypothetical protein
METRYLIFKMKNWFHSTFILQSTTTFAYDINYNLTLEVANYICEEQGFQAYI